MDNPPPQGIHLRNAEICLNNPSHLLTSSLGAMRFKIATAYLYERLCSSSLPKMLDMPKCFQEFFAERMA